MLSLFGLQGATYMAVYPALFQSANLWLVRPVEIPIHVSEVETELYWIYRETHVLECDKWGNIKRAFTFVTPHRA